MDEFERTRGVRGVLHAFALAPGVRVAVVVLPPHLGFKGVELLPPAVVHGGAGVGPHLTRDRVRHEPCVQGGAAAGREPRSEERRVGKECRSQWLPHQLNYEVCNTGSSRWTTAHPLSS